MLQTILADLCIAPLLDWLVSFPVSSRISHSCCLPLYEVPYLYALPWEIALHKIEQDVSNCLNIIPATLFKAEVSVD
jgi:hypothetical protein